MSDSLLNTNNAQTYLDNSNYWIVNIVTRNGDVYQMLGRLYDLQPAINQLRDAIIDDGMGLIDGSSIAEIVIV